MAEAWYRQAFGAHYPVLYAHRDVDEARRCLALLPRLAPLTIGAHDSCLDLGCGDGRHLTLLRQAGHDAVGLDLSSALLTAARRRLSADTVAPPLVRGDMRYLPWRENTFSAVLSLFTAFGYFTPRAANATVVSEVARVLRPGGHWFLDYVDADRVRDELSRGAAPVREREAGPLLVHERRYLREAETVVAKDVALRARPGHEEAAARCGVGPPGLRYTEQVALFSRAELDGMAATAGLRRVAAAGDYDGCPLGAGSRWLLAYRRDSHPSSEVP